MSFCTDVNILLYAVNSDSEFHGSARRFMEEKASSSEMWLLPWPVIHSFIRISTHPRIMPRPLSAEQAVGVIEQIMNFPGTCLCSEGEDFWPDYSATIKKLHLRGNDIPDIHLISTMRTHGVTILYTKDRGFARFRGIRVIDPL